MASRLGFRAGCPGSRALLGPTSERPLQQRRSRASGSPCRRWPSSPARPGTRAPRPCPIGTARPRRRSRARTSVTCARISASSSICARPSASTIALAVRPEAIMVSNTPFAMAPLMRPCSTSDEQLRQALGRDRGFTDRPAGLLQGARELAHHPVADGLRAGARGDHRLEEVRRARATGSTARRRTREGRARRQTGPGAGPGSSGIAARMRDDPFGRDDDRRQVRLGEVPVVVGLLLAAHRDRRARRGDRRGASPARRVRPARRHPPAARSRARGPSAEIGTS